MKVLFAVNNDDISNAIVKKYQKEYKEILSYKSVYYFNAILKELQKDKTYDRVVISEDLEPFANNNYDAIDKFLFDKLDNISDEAINERGKDTDIILICTDRRTKTDDILVKLFGIGIYNAILGQDRSIDEVCKLINRPRTKKNAKIYYNIDSENVGYKHENEDSVSETEVQNILAHYKRLGRNEEKYIESFNNIVSQYNDNQLKIIIRYLPIGVKAVLEEKSQKYQELVSSDVAFPNQVSTNSNNKKKETTKKEPIKVKMLENESEKSNIKGKIVIPTRINKTGVKKLIKQQEPIVEDNLFDEIYDDEDDYETNEDINGVNLMDELDNDQEMVDEPKRGRGRPKKILTQEKQIQEKPKRGRGRPKKNTPVFEEEQQNEEDDEDIDLFNLDNIDDELKEQEITQDIQEQEDDDDIDLFNLVNENDIDTDTNYDDLELLRKPKDNRESKSIDNINNIQTNNKVKKEEDFDLFNLNNDNEEEQEENDDEFDLFNLVNDNYNDENEEDSNKSFNQIAQTDYKPKTDGYESTLISKDKKIVSFVGTTKNGTSFIVNNVAHLLASRGIKTAILDMTKTRNAYYIYTNSEEKLIQKAKNCINKLKSGLAEGIEINKNLSVYTSVPEDNSDYSDVKTILETLAKNYAVVLIDTDFDTPQEYFDASQEIYLVQSMDVLTMQPLTAFLRNLQSKGILKEEKLRVIINKTVNIKSVSIKVLIGGISKYNDPSMSYMKDLFDKDKIKYCQIPFELPNYIKYLDSVITCKISLNGYTGTFISALNELGNMIYPVINNSKTYTPIGNNSFSNEMNDTLNKMKKYQ